MKKFVAMFVIMYSIVILSVRDMEAQSLDACYNTGCTETWNTETASTFTDLTKITYNYKWRICNGVVEFQFEIDNILSTNGFFAKESINELDLDGEKAYAEMHALNTFLSILRSNNVSIPDCDPGRPFIRFFTARCGMWVKCSFPITNGTVHCDNCWTGDQPSTHSVPPQGNFVDVWKYQDCGTICCEKDFSICLEYDVTHTFSTYRIKNVTRGPAPGAACSGANTCTHWDGGTIPCFDGCQGDGN